MLSLFSRKKRARTKKDNTLTGCKPRLELLEDRTLLSAFVDNFEGPTLDPFWNRSTQISGNISLTQSQVHTGNQAVQFTTTNTRQNKYVNLGHLHSEPGYGRTSVWVYDTGADRASSNYLQFDIGNSASGRGRYFVSYDYDLGPNNGGVYYVGNWQGQDNINTGVDRTQAWHQFTFDSRPESLTFQIDGRTVQTMAGGFQFDSVTFWMYGPSWRPAWTGYFDDFEFTPYGQSDLAPTQLAWSPTQGGVDFSYQVTGAELPQDTSAALYWANGPTENDIIDLAANPVTIPKTTPLNTPITEHIPASDLFTPPPAGATHLVLVVDPGQLISETDETNNLKALVVPDIAMLSAELQTGNTVQFTYETTGHPSAFQMGLYRSADATFDLSDSLIATQTVTPNPTNPQAPGSFSLPSPSPFDPSKPYLLVVADPAEAISESNEDNNVGFLQLPDMVATSLNFDSGQFTYSYEIIRADLPADTEMALFWSYNDTFEPGGETLAFSFPIQGQDRRVGTYEGSIAKSDLLRNKPAGATCLLLVLDPPTLAMPDGKITESNETNNVKAFQLVRTCDPGNPGGGNDEDPPPRAPIVIPVPDPDEFRRRARPPIQLPEPRGRPFLKFLLGDQGTPFSIPNGSSSNLMLGTASLDTFFFNYDGPGVLDQLTNLGQLELALDV